jgi:hypothetical protein
MSEADRQAVVGQTGFNASHASEGLHDFLCAALRGSDDGGTAVSENGAGHSASSAPVELRSHTGMPDQHSPAASDQRSYQHGAVADVEVHVPQRSLEMLEGSDVRHIEETAITPRDLEANGRRVERVQDRPGFDDEAGNHDRPFERELTPNADGPAVHDAPCRRRRVYRTCRSLFQSAGMIRMAMRNEDRRWSQIANPPEPILAAINEHPTLPGRQKHR